MAKIIIQSTERPDAARPEQMIRWFCVEFGLSGSDEENSIGEQILREFAMAAQQNRALTSSEVSTALNKVISGKPIPRSTVIYHLNRFIDAGLIVKKGRLYYLRATEMSKTIEEIEFDIEREMSRMLDAAREFDRMMQNMFNIPAAPQRPIIEEKEKREKHGRGERKR